MNRLEYADLYLRLSIDRDGKTAIERQERDCREWAARNALTVREIHVDRGRSGFRNGVQRRGLDAALAAVTAGIVRTLVVWRLDRFSRQGIGEVGLALDKIEEAGARLVSVTENLDTSEAQDRLLVTTLSEIARRILDGSTLITVTRWLNEERNPLPTRPRVAGRLRCPASARAGPRRRPPRNRAEA